MAYLSQYLLQKLTFIFNVLSLEEILPLYSQNTSWYERIWGRSEDVEIICCQCGLAVNCCSLRAVGRQEENRATDRKAQHLVGLFLAWCRSCQTCVKTEFILLILYDVLNEPGFKKNNLDMSLSLFLKTIHEKYMQCIT